MNVDDAKKSVQSVWDSMFTLESAVLKSERVYLEDGSYWWGVIRNKNGSDINPHDISKSDFNLGFFDSKTSKRKMFHIHPDNHDGISHLQNQNNERFNFPKICVNSLCVSSDIIIKEIVSEINHPKLY